MKNQIENPNGLHAKYSIKKLIMVKNPNYGLSPSTVPYGKRRVDKEYLTKEIPCDKGSEYFIMRLDDGGNDINHIKACRIGVHAYADAIEPYIPQLAKDLREKYPLL